MPSYWFDHVHLNSPDPLKAAEFYEQILGAKKIRTGELPGGRTLIDLDLNGLVIKVTHPRDKTLSFMTDYGLDHFGLATDDLQEAVDDLKAKGVKFLQEITGLRHGVKISFFLTPENVWIELVERKDH